MEIGMYVETWDYTETIYNSDTGGYSRNLYLLLSACRNYHDTLKLTVL